MTFWFSHILLGSCLELLGANLAIDTYAELPWYSNGYDCSAGCSTSIVGGPVEYAAGQCYLPLPMTDNWYDWIWCQDVTISGSNGPVAVQTPCVGTAISAAPFDVRLYLSEIACSDFLVEIGSCVRENVCTAADKLAELCTCTAAEQANNECTP